VDQAGVLGTGEDQMDETELADAPKALDLACAEDVYQEGFHPPELHQAVSGVLYPAGTPGACSQRARYTRFWLPLFDMAFRMVKPFGGTTREQSMTRPGSLGWASTQPESR
jgi:hypothetical protein